MIRFECAWCNASFAELRVILNHVEHCDRTRKRVVKTGEPRVVIEEETDELEEDAETTQRKQWKAEREQVASARLKALRREHLERITRTNRTIGG